MQGRLITSTLYYFYTLCLTKHVGSVFFCFTVVVSLTPIRYFYDEEQKRLWQLEENGWWQEKWPGLVDMETALSCLGDC